MTPCTGISLPITSYLHSTLILTRRLFVRPDWCFTPWSMSLSRMFSKQDGLIKYAFCRNIMELYVISRCKVSEIPLFPTIRQFQHFALIFQKICTILLLLISSQNTIESFLFLRSCYKIQTSIPTQPLILDICTTNTEEGLHSPTACRIL